MLLPVYHTPTLPKILKHLELGHKIQSESSYEASFGQKLRLKFFVWLVMTVAWELMQKMSEENSRQEKFQQNISDRKNSSQHIGSAQDFRQKILNNEINTCAQKCKECSAHRGNHQAPDQH